MLNQFTNHLQANFSEGLKLLSSHTTEAEDYCVTLYHLTFNNIDYQRDEAPYSITNNSEDYQDLCFAIEEFLISHKSENFSNPGYSVNCILCSDTANPYNIINIIINFEHDF